MPFDPQMHSYPLTRSVHLFLFSSSSSSSGIDVAYSSKIEISDCLPENNKAWFKLNAYQFEKTCTNIMDCTNTTCGKDPENICTDVVRGHNCKCGPESVLVRESMLIYYVNGTNPETDNSAIVECKTMSGGTENECSSSSLFRQQCRTTIAEDFRACVALHEIGDLSAWNISINCLQKGNFFDWSECPHREQIQYWLDNNSSSMVSDPDCKPKYEKMGACFPGVEKTADYCDINDCDTSLLNPCDDSTNFEYNKCFDLFRTHKCECNIGFNSTIKTFTVSNPHAFADVGTSYDADFCDDIDECQYPELTCGISQHADVSQVHACSTPGPPDDWKCDCADGYRVELREYTPGNFFLQNSTAPAITPPPLPAANSNYSGENNYLGENVNGDGYSGTNYSDLNSTGENSSNSGEETGITTSVVRRLGSSVLQLLRRLGGTTTDAGQLYIYYHLHQTIVNYIFFISL